MFNNKKKPHDAAHIPYFNKQSTARMSNPSQNKTPKLRPMHIVQDSYRFIFSVPNRSCSFSLLSALLLRLERKVRVHPATTQRQQHAKPLPRAKDLALAVPTDTENENRLQVADNIESERARAANDQELRQVVHGRHDARRACAPEDLGGDFADARNGVEERNEWDEEADGDGGLVEQELWW
jgi:hypothetical protein